ncbi:MAG: class F sortase [Litorilinea sp.]
MIIRTETMLQLRAGATSPPRARRFVMAMTAMLMSLALIACGGAEPAAPAPTADAANATAATSADAQTSSSTVAPIEPLALEQSQPPVRLQIPDLGLDIPVTEMGWQVTMADDTRTTTWVVPETSLGWHANSAGVGAAGNTILSGRQVGDSAPLAALALGDIQIGQEVHITDVDGLVFIYRISEISDPIPAAGATEADESRAATYFGPTNTARLTLATGWPEFTTTHRIFAVGELIGVAP